MAAVNRPSSSANRAVFEVSITRSMKTISRGPSKPSIAEHENRQSRAVKTVNRGARKSSIAGSDHQYCQSRSMKTVHRGPSKPSIAEALTLQLDYVDLCLIHFPIRIKEEVGITMKDPEPQDLLPFDMEGTWKALEDCFRKGLTKAIGVSNFSSKKIMDLIKVAEIPPSVNQVEMHPLWHQKQLRETCKRFDIHVSAWSPLGAPRESWGSPDILNEKVIKEIAAKRGKSPTQVALIWGLDNGVSVIPKSFNRTRMEENLQMFDWHLTEQDHEAIGKLKQRRNSPAYAFCHPEFGSYKTIQDLWDGEVTASL
ncbi:hypothetical protein KP509_35G065300 [Ceratopteris richardii]|uniref:NADP-dependent oxidoreductase domain-containing protein n=1 Tax=Ceratopteris richardii TaxID=49495 RepID=A0A8T2QGA6_CERRI|nr:hypothetical protein KP509_35G065300 [Ceratopteris richardii]